MAGPGRRKMRSTNKVNALKLRRVNGTACAEQLTWRRSHRKKLVTRLTISTSALERRTWRLFCCSGAGSASQRRASVWELRKAESAVGRAAEPPSGEPAPPNGAGAGERTRPGHNRRGSQQGTRGATALFPAGESVTHPGQPAVPRGESEEYPAGLSARAADATQWGGQRCSQQGKA